MSGRFYSFSLSCLLPLTPISSREKEVRVKAAIEEAVRGGIEDGISGALLVALDGTVTVLSFSV